jgi:hypothetical protein
MYHPHVALYIFLSTTISCDDIKCAAHCIPLQNALYFKLLPVGFCIIHILHTGWAKILT